MNVANYFARLFSRKESPSRRLVAMHRIGQPVSTPRNYEGFSQEGYQKNVVAFRAVSGISQACSGIPFLLYKRTRQGPMEFEDHEILKLLRRPNPMQGQSKFTEALVAFYLISGNTYIEAVGPKRETYSKPSELWVPRPDRMRILPGAHGMPQAYEYHASGSKYRYEVDFVRGKSPILHLKTFNPVDDWYGMSPVEAAAMAVDQHNESGTWNLALLQNKATPSGALVASVSERNPAGSLTDEQYERLEQKLDEKYTGSHNAGRPLILEGGLDWKTMGFSPQDMDWIQGKNTSARDIAMAFNYPPILLGIPGDSTYNNQKEARLALYEEAVLPIMDALVTEFNNWLTPLWGDDIFLGYDKDAIDALAPKREAIWARVQTADFLTVNEKREAVGYEPVDGGDTILTQASLIPLELASDADFGQSDPGPEDDPEDDKDDKKAQKKSPKIA